MRNNERPPIGAEVWAVPARDDLEWLRASCVDVFKGVVEGYEEPEYTKIYPSCSTMSDALPPDPDGGLTVCKKPLRVKLMHCCAAIPHSRVFLTLTEALHLLREEAVLEGRREGEEEARRRLIAQLNGDDYDD